MDNKEIFQNMTKGESFVEYCNKKLLETKKFLGNDTGVLETSDTMQIKSFMRGQQAAFAMALDKFNEQFNGINPESVEKMKEALEYCLQWNLGSGTTGRKMAEEALTAATLH